MATTKQDIVLGRTIAAPLETVWDTLDGSRGDAIMAVPAHDQRDFEFARQHDLPGHGRDPTRGRRPVDPATMTEALPHEGSWSTAVRSTASRRRPRSQGAPGSRPRATGAPSVNFRLRDWLLSRQRYWGAPIPIVHCPTCGEVPVPDDQLPVLLPDDVDFSLGGESPLARHPTWKHVTCPNCGGEAAARHRHDGHVRGFVSWYFFRYCSPGYEDGPFRREDVERWMPVGQYTGGVEHAILHLLYCAVLHEGPLRHGDGRRSSSRSPG